MNRKQMIETIAKEAGCSKRLVRKKLFRRYLELKKTCPNILFYKVFLDKNTEWHNFNEEHDFRTKNTFEVCFFPSGCVVLFKNIDIVYKDGEVGTETVGERLYSFHHV